MQSQARLRFFNQPLGLPGDIKFIQAFEKVRYHFLSVFVASGLS
jgi:hypothetical protein